MNENVNTLKVREKGFPEILRHIPSPPARLYWLGQPFDSWLSRPKLAVVGSRRMTAYGQGITQKLVSELAKAGVVIISGLAYGIDITAHRAALEAGGTTVAVLGTGLDDIYPAAHFQVAQRITEKGTILSEYPPKTPGYPGNFVIRNRIISGLCDVLLITEAVLKSGSLHTARFALEQGKTVMAVPGNVSSPASEGCNNLIKSGAIPATSADDIFFALKIKPAERSAAKPFAGSHQEALIIGLMKQGVTAQDQLALTAKLDSRTLSSALTMLELSGHIRPAGGGHWILA